MLSSGDIDGGGRLTVAYGHEIAATFRVFIEAEPGTKISAELELAEACGEESCGFFDSDRLTSGVDER